MQHTIKSLLLQVQIYMSTYSLMKRYINYKFIMSIIKKIQSILIMIKIFYWFMFKAFIKAVFHKNIRLTSYFWAEYCSEYFQIQLFKCNRSQPIYRQQRALILANHRSQADFFIHNVVTDHQCNFLARLAVAFLFMVFSLASYDVVWFFNRSGHADPEKFNEWLDYKFTKSRRPLLLAYPEGHRMGEAASVSPDNIKSGMIRVNYAYRRSLPCQFLMTFGNEKVFNQKKLLLAWGEPVYFSFSKIYLPKDYKDENQFVAVIRQEFVNYFDEIYKMYGDKGKAVLVRDYAQPKIQ